MGIEKRHLLDRKRSQRLYRNIAVSPFTIFLLGFGLSYWIILMFTTVVTVECEYAVIWISGWFEFASLYQWTVVAIGLSAATWLARVLFIRALNRIETIIQFMFILVLVAVAISQKAYLFPYGIPSNEHIERAVQLVWRNDLRLMEEQDILIDIREGWKFDYPPPPFASSPEHPLWDETINLRLPQIFESKNSPTWKEYQRMFTCFADYQSVVAEYHLNMKIWKEYWDGFEDWYVLNSWRYDDEDRIYRFWWHIY